MKFYIQDSRSYVGNCIVFWRKEGKGYTTKLDEAWIVGEEFIPWRETDILIPIKEIEECSRKTVDIQDLRILRKDGKL